MFVGEGREECCFEVVEVLRFEADEGRAEVAVVMKFALFLVCVGFGGVGESPVFDVRVVVREVEVGFAHALGDAMAVDGGGFVLVGDVVVGEEVCDLFLCGAADVFAVVSGAWGAVGGLFWSFEEEGEESHRVVYVVVFFKGVAWWFGQRGFL